MDLHELSAVELGRELGARRVGAREVATHLLQRIEKLDPELGSFLCVTKELTFAAADAADARRAGGEPCPPLAGVPIAVKDNISLAGYPTTCGSRILRDYRPPYDACVVEKVKSGGLAILGKTNMDEFGMGSSTEFSAFHPVANPWDAGRVPGGSSGGSAAAVAARLTPLALGSDTGGSIRQPASLCGVVGLKPTYGTVSRFGLVAYASSLDQIGPLARTVEDCAAVFALLAGRDARDATTVDTNAGSLLEAIRQPPAGLRVGVVREMMGEGVTSGTRAAICGALRVIEGLGAIVEETSLPNVDDSIPTYYVLACAEASSNLARYDGVRYGHRARQGADLAEMYSRTRAEGFGPEVKRRVMLGTFVLSSGYYEAYYGRAQRVRTLIRRDFERAFSRYDLLIGACSPTPAFRRGEKSGNPLEMYAADVCTVSVNLAGLPGLAVPCGFSEDGLPIGLQIIGRPNDETTVLRLGQSYQVATDFHRKTPPLS